MADDLREKANKLPLRPGVYIMKDRDSQVIYVGKAKLLKNRVSSYFRGAHDAKTTAMVSRVDDFEVIIADSEFEALVLEDSLIKHHKPKYNIMLKDDKGYPFIRVDLKAEYPSFSIVSKPGTDGAKYFGPYGGRGITMGAIEAVCKALKLPTCGRKFPRDIGKERPCLNYHMNACRGYCLADASADEYRESVSSAVMILGGKTSELTERLEKEMEEDAESLRFELAAEKRDKLRAVQALGKKQRVVAGGAADTDAVGFYRGEAKSCFVVLHYIEGNLLSKDLELLDIPVEDDTEAISGIIRRYYERRGVIPENILLPCELTDSGDIAKMFSESCGHRVSISAPRRGEKRKLVEAAGINAKEESERVTTREGKTLFVLKWLQTSLGLADPPDRIEAFDISNTGSSEIVASMTVFSHGKPLKRDYRHFQIKSLDGQDDCRSIAEAVSRRIKRYADGDPKFSELPDLMLIDGGENQVKAALDAINGAGINVPVFGMVKDERHRTRAIVSSDGGEIGISGNPSVFAFVGNIQEETHRFAIEYHRKLRSKRGIGSKLDEIGGVGEKRRAALLKKFGSVKAIGDAQAEELAQVVPKDVAERIYGFFHSEIGE